jgi:hypothetical protein
MQFMPSPESLRADLPEAGLSAFVGIFTVPAPIQ